MICYVSQFHSLFWFKTGCWVHEMVVKCFAHFHLNERHQAGRQRDRVVVNAVLFIFRDDAFGYATESIKHCAQNAQRSLLERNGGWNAEKRNELICDLRVRLELSHSGEQACCCSRTGRGWDHTNMDIRNWELHNLISINLPYPLLFHTFRCHSAVCNA